MTLVISDWPLQQRGSRSGEGEPLVPDSADSHRSWPKPAPVRFGSRALPLVDPASVSLLELDRAMGDRTALSAIAGLSAVGLPVVFDLLRPDTSHVLAVGPDGWGKSTLLRTLVASLCLRSRPNQLGVIGIDLGGRELSLLDALPHRLSSLARDCDEAADLLIWLEREIEARSDGRAVAPGLLLAVDDLEWLAEPDQSENLQRLSRVLRKGPASGVHVVAAARESVDLESLFRIRGIVEARPPAGQGQAVLPRGQFDFRAGQWRCLAQGAFLSASDLNLLVTQLTGVLRRGGDSLSRWQGWNGGVWKEAGR